MRGVWLWIVFAWLLLSAVAAPLSGSFIRAGMGPRED